MGPGVCRSRFSCSDRYGFSKVIDDGLGIEGTILNKIFYLFFTTKTVGFGTGLVLSVVAGIVKEWGGSIDVESRPARTVFTVHVPRAVAKRQAAE